MNATSQTIVKTSAPGSLMLMGEHAVLHGRRAIVCAVTRRLNLTLIATDEQTITIKSALGETSCPLDRVNMEKPHTFLLAALQRQQEKLPSGLAIEIESDFPSDIGLGSSAAVTVATTAAIRSLIGLDLSRDVLLEESVQAVRSVQGLGSGADVAASVFGGIVAYRADPREVTSIRATHPLTVVYSGSKMPTVEVVKRVEDARGKAPERFESIFDQIDAAVAAATKHIGQGEWEHVGRLLDVNQDLMDALGVSNTILEEIVDALRKQPGILGAKISGSGLGDCVLGLGRAEQLDLPYTTVEAEISPDGVTIEQA